MTSMQIIHNESGEPYEFLGEQIAYAEGEPYPDLDNYFEYAVYRRAEDNYFICVNFSTSEYKAVEAEKQIVDFFGFDPIAKLLYAYLGISITVEISNFEHGQGNQFILNGADEKDYSFVGKLIHRSFVGQSDDVHEVYKLNISGYISTVLNYRGYTQVELLDEYDLTTMIC